MAKLQGYRLHQVSDLCLRWVSYASHHTTQIFRDTTFSNSLAQTPSWKDMGCPAPQFMHFHRISCLEDRRKLSDRLFWLVLQCKLASIWIATSSNSKWNNFQEPIRLVEHRWKLYLVWPKMVLQKLDSPTLGVSSLGTQYEFVLIWFATCCFSWNYWSIYSFESYLWGFGVLVVSGT